MNRITKNYGLNNEEKDNFYNFIVDLVSKTTDIESTWSALVGQWRQSQLDPGGPDPNALDLPQPPLRKIQSDPSVHKRSPELAEDLGKRPFSEDEDDDLDLIPSKRAHLLGKKNWALKGGLEISPEKIKNIDRVKYVLTQDIQSQLSDARLRVTVKDPSKPPTGAEEAALLEIYSLVGDVLGNEKYLMGQNAGKVFPMTNLPIDNLAVRLDKTTKSRVNIRSGPLKGDGSENVDDYTTEKLKGMFDAASNKDAFLAGLRAEKVDTDTIQSEDYRGGYTVRFIMLTSDLADAPGIHILTEHILNTVNDAKSYAALFPGEHDRSFGEMPSQNNPGEGDDRSVTIAGYNAFNDLVTQGFIDVTRNKSNLPGLRKLNTVLQNEEARKLIKMYGSSDTLTSKVFDKISQKASAKQKKKHAKVLKPRSVYNPIDPEAANKIVTADTTKITSKRNAERFRRTGSITISNPSDADWKNMDEETQNNSVELMKGGLEAIIKMASTTDNPEVLKVIQEQLKNGLSQINSKFGPDQSN